MNWKNQVQEIIHSAKDKVVDLNLSIQTIKYDKRIKLHRDITALIGDEEVVRSFLINHLVNSLDYRAELIEVEKEYTYKTIGRPKARGDKGRIDVIVNDSEGKPFFFIEVKEPEKWENDKKYIEGQLFNLAEEEQKKFGTKIRYLVYYTLEVRDGHIVDKAIIIDYVAYASFNAWVDAGYPSISDSLSAQYNEPQKEPLTKGGRRDLRKQFTLQEIKGLATDLHNVLWGGGGTQDTDVFNSLVNIILTKIQDEYDTEDGKSYTVQLYQYGNQIEKPEVLFERVNRKYRVALKEQLYVDGDLSEQFIVNRQKFPLNKLVYTVQRLQDLSFVDGKSSFSGKDILGDFFEQIQRDGFKQTKGQFFTPSNIVRFILYALEIDNLALQRLNESRDFPYIIDPSCGSGTFLIEAMITITNEVKRRRRSEVRSSRNVQDRFDDLLTPDSKENRWAREYIYGIEHNFDLGTAAKVNMILHGDGSTNIFVRDGLLPFRLYSRPAVASVLQANTSDPFYFDKEVNGRFDVVISNPPFSVNLDRETKRYLPQNFIFGDKKNSENLFIERYYQLLREGGRLGVVLPESIFDTSDNKYIRLFFYKYFNIKAVISIPPMAFQPHTSTKTSIILAQKKTQAEVADWNSVWLEYSKEWNKLRTRVENYFKVFVNKEDRNKLPSIKNDEESQIKNNLQRLLKDSIIREDLELSIEEIISKYSSVLKQAIKVDSDMASVFGYINTSWVFGEVARRLDKSVFLGEAENIGYKRTKRGERVQPNELFNVEVAPNRLNLNNVSNLYEEEKKGLVEAQAQLRVTQLKNEDDALKIKITNDRLISLEKDLISLETEKSYVVSELTKYYSDQGQLLPEYNLRVDKDLLKLFMLKRLSIFRSNEVFVRTVNPNTLLDLLRQKGLWQ